MTAYDLGSSPRGRGKLGEFHDLGVSERLIPAWAGKTAGGGGLGSHDLGSSPRGRGKLSRALPPRCRRRLIPAWAGKTAWRRLSARGSPAHPRVGGENICRLSRPRCLTGSSPRGRGKLDDHHAPTHHQGLIPAWAGKTLRLVSRRMLRGAHPRVGGENPVATLPATMAPGSSPRGRGKRNARGRTPASPGAHPRVGGENMFSAPRVQASRGSSPRGRGKLRHTVHQLPRLRLIPAWAGKTVDAGSFEQVNRAHPRVGGENSCHWETFVSPTGSSPRGRGKPGETATARPELGLIPAWAGKTYPKCPRPIGGRAHPRVGGENRHCPVSSSTCPGSSPRGRGKPTSARPASLSPRLIPAWAGKTLSDLRFYRADRSDLGNP